MPYTNAWNTTRPAGSVSAKNIDDEIRLLRLQLQERFNDALFVDFAADPVVLKDSVAGLATGLTKIIGFPNFIASTNKKEVDFFRNGYITAFSDTDSLVCDLGVHIPVGCVVTQIEWLADQDDCTDLTCEFIRRPFANGAFSTGNFVVLNTVTVNTGWGIHASTTLAVTIAADQIYYLSVEGGGAAGNSFLFGGVRVTFNRDSIAHAT